MDERTHQLIDLCLTLLAGLAVYLFVLAAVSV